MVSLRDMIICCKGLYLEDDFKFPNSLEHLSIKDDLLTGLPEGISCLGLLRVLHLECQNLSSLPAEGVGGLTSLLELQLIECSGLNALPGSINKLTNLQILVREAKG